MKTEPKRIDILFGLDVDNTLVNNRPAWDELFWQTSLKLYDRKRAFRMLRHPDGKPDRTFSQMSTSEFWKQRLGQVGLDPHQEDESLFFRTLNKLSLSLDYRRTAIPYWGMPRLIQEVRAGSIYKPRLLSTGTRGMQSKVMADLGLTSQFNWDESRFHGEFKTKADGLADMAGRYAVDRLVYVGDAASDMKALHEAPVDVGVRFAIGFIGGGLSTAKQLADAGAHYIIPHYTREHVETSVSCAQTYRRAE